MTESSIHMDKIVLRWDPPRTCGTVMHLLEKRLKHQISQLRPVHGRTDVKEEDVEKEVKKETKDNTQDDEEKNDDQQVVVSGASTASVGQPLSGRHLSLKLHALLQGCPSSEGSLPTSGLHVFEDLILGRRILRQGL
ncbi:hypothetical protein N9L68_07240 [bacterium]|nr:hypothetical protein [bacterium]